MNTASSRKRQQEVVIDLTAKKPRTEPKQPAKRQTILSIISEMKENKLLSDAGIESTIPVAPLSQESHKKPRITVHFKSEDTDVELLKKIKETETLKADTDADPDLLEVLKQMRKNEQVYTISLIDRNLNDKLLDDIEKELRGWNQEVLFNVLGLCCFFQVSDANELLLNISLTQTRTTVDLCREERCKILGALNTIGNGGYGGELETLAETAEVTVMNNTLRGYENKLFCNMFGVSTRTMNKGKQNAMEGFPETLQVSEFDIFVSACEQVSLLYQKVIVEEMKLSKFYSWYTKCLKNNENLFDGTRLIKIMALRKILNRLDTIRRMYSNLKSGVAVFNYRAWNTKNIQMLVQQRQRIQDNQIIRYIGSNLLHSNGRTA